MNIKATGVNGFKPRLTDRHPILIGQFFKCRSRTRSAWGLVFVNTQPLLTSGQGLWGTGLTKLGGVWGTQIIWGENILAGSQIIWGECVWDNQIIWGESTSGVARPLLCVVRGYSSGRRTGVAASHCH